MPPSPLAMRSVRQRLLFDECNQFPSPTVVAKVCRSAAHIIRHKECTGCDGVARCLLCLVTPSSADPRCTPRSGEPAVQPSSRPALQPASPPARQPASRPPGQPRSRRPPSRPATRQPGQPASHPTVPTAGAEILQRRWPRAGKFFWPSIQSSIAEQQANNRSGATGTQRQREPYD